MSPSSLAKLRIVAINDVYELKNLPKFQTFLKQLQPKATSVVLAGDFLSPSTLSSIDQGRGMVATLRAVGMTHASLGNHEADMSLNQLQQRIQDMAKAKITLINTNLRHPPPGTDEWWLAQMAPPYSIVPTACGRVNVALLGLLSDERQVFRDQTFRAAPIGNVQECFQQVHDEIYPTRKADFVLPMTHMSLKRDQALAETMLKASSTVEKHGVGLILGGHEHEPFDERVEDGNAHVRILKSGTEAQNATLVDLTFDTQADNKLVDLEADIVSMEPFESSVVVQAIVNQHMKVVNALDEEVLVHAETLLPPGTPLSSERSRYQQTTAGGLLCKAVKDELGVDVAIINGATLKGGTVYENDQITYASLKKELPFPTKMVVVEMKRWELLEAIHYSRTHTETGEEVRTEEDKKTVPRRGYMQVDMDFDEEGLSLGGPLLEDTLKVALPRNLMGGFCRILPLMDLGKRLKEEGMYPGPDDFVPAIQLVIRHFSKNLWLDIVGESFTFDEIDLNGDQVLDREEIKIMMTKYLGHEPPDFVVDDMINAIDEDENGVIDHGEFSYLLATMEREDIFRKLL